MKEKNTKIRFILVIEGKALITYTPSLTHQQCSLNQEQFMAFTVGRQVSGPNRL
jgi:hypothetical protein